MAASYNAKKIILKNLTFEIMDDKKCPVRNVFYVITLLKRKVLKKHWEYDLYKERSSIP